MENSNKPSSSSVQDVAKSPEKKSLANKNAKKISPMKAAKIQKSKKQAAQSKKSTTLGSLKKKGTRKVSKKSLAKSIKKSPFKVKAAKKQAATLKKSTSSSEGLLKTRTASNRASLDSLMAGFQIQGRAKTALGMPLKDFSESAVSLLLSNYKVENEKVLSTTALAM